MKKKLLIIGMICLILFMLTGVDYLISKNYEFKIISVTPERGVADGNTSVEFTIQLSHKGKLIEGHNIYAITDKGRIARKKTDENGIVIFNYRCYLASTYNALEDINITFYDEDNSIFIYVPSKYVYTLGMDSPEDNLTNKTVDDFFYD
jgi:hypothetical protein